MLIASIEKVEGLHMCLSSCEYDLNPNHLDDITWDDEHYTLKVTHTTVSFTAMEYCIVSSLRYGHPVSYPNLARLTYNRELDRKVLTMLHKHVERIRDKLRGTGVYIYCVLNYGYFLLPEILSDTTT
jgi:DNA-binding response OmpR family regulator